MREIYIKSKAGLLPIGRRGENLATRVHLAEVPSDGQAVTVFILRNGDSVAYPASQVEITDTEIVWTVTSVDTGKSGRGKVQYRFADSVTGEVIKTEIYGFLVGLAIDTEVGPVPDPYESIADRVADLAGQAQVAARDAEASATAAAESAESASESAQSAEQSASSAGAYATNAQTFATTATQKAAQAAASEANAQTYASQAATSATSAGQSATAASASATSASQSATTATSKAAEASASATTATTKASEASASATAAQTAQTGAETAQAGAETAAQTAQAGADAVGLLREQIYNSYPNVEAEAGPIVSITDGADGIPVKSLVVGIEPAQTGSGVPSPDNVRPITGWTGVNIYRYAEYDAEAQPTYPITFPSEAGTVYGGSLDVTSGVLTVTKGLIASYAGETLPRAWISDRDAYEEGTTPTTGAQVVYELATPITYQLTPAEVTTLLGSNNIWADTGDVQEMTYRADTKLYIDEVFEDYQDDLADYADALAALG